MEFETLEYLTAPALSVRQVFLKLYPDTRLMVKDTKNAKLFDGRCLDMSEDLLDRNVVTIIPKALPGCFSKLVIEVEAIKKKGGRK